MGFVFAGTNRMMLEAMLPKRGGGGGGRASPPFANTVITGSERFIWVLLSLVG